MTESELNAHSDSEVETLTEATQSEVDAAIEAIEERDQFLVGS